MPRRQLIRVPAIRARAGPSFRMLPVGGTLKDMQAMDIRRRSERRRFDKPPEYPLRDSSGQWVVRNRRRLVDRRSNPTALDALEAVRKANQGSLMLHYHDQVMNLHAHGDPFIMGRRRTCNLVVKQDYVSREHARIVFRQGRFILIDQSLNGTCVRLQNGDVFHVHQGELLLTGSGYISLGQALSDNGDDLVYFFCRAPPWTRSEEDSTEIYRPARSPA
jgi:hypothetical protein